MALERLLLDRAVAVTTAVAAVGELALAPDAAILDALRRLSVPTWPR